MTEPLDYVVSYSGAATNVPSQIETNKARLNTTTSSFSHILGNLTAIIEKYMEDMMPYQYFKQKRITTEAAFKDIRNYKKNLIEFERPYLIIEPKILMADESASLPWINWDRFNPTDVTDVPNLYMMNHEFFLNDKDAGFFLGYTINRYKFEFNVTILVDTQMQRISLENYLKSNFRFRHMFTIARYTETMIPGDYIQYIATKYAMSITSDAFLTKLNQHSKWSILRLHRPATDKTEFFIIMMATLQLRLPNYPNGDKVVIGRIERHSQVQFTIELETNVMNNFLMITQEEVTSTEPMKDYMVRINLSNRAPTYAPIIGNKTAFTKITMEFETITEKIDLSKFINSDVIPVLTYIRNNHLIDDYVALKIYKWDQEIDVTNINLVEFDKINYTLNLKNLEKDTMYNVIIYFDMTYIAKLKPYITPVNTTAVDYPK
jgi:hypothetical protein